MAIIFKPFEELFAPEYQLTYISTDGHITVGPYTYSVFHYYTIGERQIIFQQCEKHLPWEYTQEQEQWERTMYMYQYIIKSPPPFPYEEYPLNEEIVMAIDWKVKFTKKANITLNKETQEPESHYSAIFQRFDTAEPEIILNTVNIGDAILETPEQKIALWDLVYKQYEKQPVPDSTINDLETAGRNALVAKEK